MLSIIIPTLNEEKYIGNLLTGLWRQDYKNFEIIIVDGNSEDCTLEVADRYAKNLDLNARLINSGIRNASGQRNIGAETAFGDKLVFIDADITIPKKNLLRILQAKLGRHPAVAVPVRVDPDEESAVERIASDFFNGLMYFLNFIGVPNGRGAVIGADAKYFRKVRGFNRELAVAEDVDLFRRLSVFGKIGTTASAVFESPRRYRRLGLVQVMLSWSVNGIWAFLFKRSLTKYNKGIR